MHLPFRMLVPVFRSSSITALLACAALPLTGCGGQSGPPPPPPQGVAITVQPLSQTVPISETATFTVTATGTAPLSYQWSENGQEIPGAVEASYTTPAIALGDSGSTLIGSFQVTVSNAVNSVASNTVTLNAGARSPKPGDLRYLLFQQVDLPGLSPIGAGAVGTAVYWFGDAVGTPLGLGSNFVCSAANGCGWPFSVLGPAPGLAMYYYQDFTTEMPFTSYLASIAAPNLVLTSMDMEPAANVMGVSWVETAQAGGFDQRLEVVPPAEIQATVAADGTASRIVTAASFDASGNANLISYGWTGDTTTVYETQTITVPAGSTVWPDVRSAASTLAGDGYAISAFGGNDTDGYVLIGIRVQGDTLPREVGFGDGMGANQDSAYSTVVAYLYVNGTPLLIYEQ
ncbi:MAG: immunoglobulin domain-containing protein [Terracidiphilus sp.]